MNATRESDDCIVPGKRANKAPARTGAAESVEERRVSSTRPFWSGPGLVGRSLWLSREQEQDYVSVLARINPCMLCGSAGRFALPTRPSCEGEIS